jgi:hypothetical protein
LGFVEGLYDLVWPEIECDLAGAIRDYFADQERVARANNPFPAGVLYEDIFSPEKSRAAKKSSEVHGLSR